MGNEPVYYIIETIRDIGATNGGDFVTVRAIDVVIANEIVEEDTFTRFLVNGRLSAQYRTRNVVTILAHNGTRDGAKAMALKMAGRGQK